MHIKTKITCEDFEAMCLRGELEHCELIDGEIVPDGPGDFAHSYVSTKIFCELSQFVKSRSLGRVLTNKTGLHIRYNPPCSRGMDVCYYSYERQRRGSIPKGFPRVAPELAVEVLGNDCDYDKSLKKVSDYHSVGVDMVWVADPHTRTVKLYPRGGTPKIIHDGGEIDGGKILPKFKVPIARFFDDE